MAFSVQNTDMLHTKPLLSLPLYILYLFNVLIHASVKDVYSTECYRLRAKSKMCLYFLCLCLRHGYKNEGVDTLSSHSDSALSIFKIMCSFSAR